MKAHLFFIPIIIILLWGVYGAFFKDLAKRQHEKGFIPGPKSLRAYVWTFRGLAVGALVLIVTLYILILTGNLG